MKYTGNKVTATIAVAGIATMAMLQILACLRIIQFNLYTFDGWNIGDVILISGMAFTTLVTFKVCMILFSSTQKYTSQYKKRIIGGSSDELHARVKLYELTDVRLREQDAELIHCDRATVSNIMENYTYFKLNSDRTFNPRDEESFMNVKRQMINIVLDEKKQIFKELGEQCIRENCEWVFSNRSKDVKLLTTKEV